MERAGEANTALKEKNRAMVAEVEASGRLAKVTADEARRLAEVGTADQGQLTSLAENARSVQERNEILEDAARSATQLLDEQAQALGEARAAQADALAAAATGDAAQHMLSQQVRSVSGQYQQAESERQRLAATTAVKDAAISRLRLWLAGSLLAIGGYLALRLAKLTPWGRLTLFWIP
ncbi:hypothetical protein [Luteolibacter sp. LG18]|uniref:hypothetical protein n=1 Tax=Luteolibacter sp. LG18 TaxID=2819286 RepID=UPI0030C765EC